MKTILDIIPVTSTHNTTLRKKPIEYIAVHYTSGAVSDKGKARDNAEYYAVTTEKASADFFVDDAEIVQYNPYPEKRYTWGVGGTKTPDKSHGGASYWGKAKNGNTISVEICSTNLTGAPTYPNDPNYKFTGKALANANKLIKYLMAEFEVPQDRVIRHFDVTGKLCPGVIGWNDASGDVKKWEAFRRCCIPSDTSTLDRYNAVFELPDWARPTIKKLCDEGILKGSEEIIDINGRPADLDLSMDMIRVLVINDRAGLYDPKEETNA